jgi:hypothetical protein
LVGIKRRNYRVDRYKKRLRKETQLALFIANIFRYCVIAIVVDSTSVIL